jgi:molybdopterin-containing oxidoreductase family iron-sulfur binding subunit
VLEKEMGKFPNANRIFLPVLCNHCEEPTCVDVCPTEATYRRDDGVVMIDYEKCIGCAACVEHCPYSVRQLVTDRRNLFADGKTAFERPVFKPIPDNVVTKCDFCYHRVDRGMVPACVEVCPTRARVFGDLADERSDAARLKERYHGWTMLPEKGTQPCVYYIG